MKISIITPTYNRSNLIERAIESILSQSYIDWEMIIVDDASTDCTKEVMNKYKREKRIKYIQCKKNEGVNIARNIGFENISEDSEAVTFLDSDDEFLPDALNNMVNELLLNPGINYFRFGVRYTNNELVSNSKHSFITADFDYYVKNLFYIGEWVCTFRRVIIDDGFQYPNKVKAFELISYIHLSQKELMYFSDKIVRIYHTGHESISNKIISTFSIQNSIKAYKIIISLYGEKIKKASKANFAILNYNLGNFLILNNEKSKGLTYTLVGFKSKPFELRLFRNVLNYLIK